ncbi:MAG: phosphate acyltransferase PlsX [Bacteroidales bacterium]|nr:phosphate acyltransferase PlsX [Bacteroidales bacterium]
MNIGLDIMGGDFAPQQTLQGVVLALNEINDNDRLFLFGQASLINDYLTKHNISLEKIEIINCPQIIEMGDEPIKAIKEKSDSSIYTGFKYLKNGLIDSFVSAGNTGAMMAGATQIIGAGKGVIRPGISSYYPNNLSTNNLLIDVGLNPDTKPEVLVQYAQMGQLFAKHVMNIDNPKVGLLNIGGEKSKGTTNTKLAHILLEQNNNINFIGNIEGGDIHKADMVDVIVCNGFTGNIVLKQAESFYKILNERNIFDSYFENYNYENYGGTPILGVSKPVIVGHGISSDIAIKNMILLSQKLIESNIAEIITKHFSYGTN